MSRSVKAREYIAVTRAVSPTLADCELTHREREPIDIALAIAEHEQYEQALRSLGVTVVRARDEPTLPDAVFVEDTAVVVDEIAVLTNPGAVSRRPEVDSVAEVLAAHRPTARIHSPGTLDGGDVLRVDRTLYVGMSSRTSPEGAAQLQTLLGDWNYEVVPVVLTGCLHLKSAVTQVAERTLLINPAFVRAECFGPVETIAVAASEPDAANALRIGESVIYAAHYPETARRLERAGIRVVRVPCRQLAKAEGGVTCCSVVFADRVSA